METRMLSTQVSAGLADRLESVGRQLGLGTDNILADALQEWLERNDFVDVIPALHTQHAPISIGRHRAIDWADSL